MNAAHAFIAFLRTEATLAEERAKSLRVTANSIEANENLQAGRKKKRKTSATGNSNSNTSATASKNKRAHTAYTLYVHENYDQIKKTFVQQSNDSPSHTTLSSKEIMALVAKQWSQISDEEKQLWRYRADQLKHAAAAAAADDSTTDHTSAAAAAAAELKLDDEDGADDCLLPGKAPTRRRVGGRRGASSRTAPQQQHLSEASRHCSV